MKTINSLRKMSQLSLHYLSKGKTIGLVPTMGALHKGHISLIQKAKKTSDIVVVSIFVNPIQFGPKEDYKKYPRNIKKDIAILKKEKIDILLYPSAQKMFPKGFNSFVQVNNLGARLCGASRPGHFVGVTTVVSKLFNIVSPTSAFFGEKDYQQALIIKKMVKDLNIGIKINLVKTARAKDGLAISSRNEYLSPKHRQQAPALYKALLYAKKMIKSGNKKISDIISSSKKIITKDTDYKIDYFDIADAVSLQPQKNFKNPTVIAAAAYLGKTRLIDNILL